MPSLSLTGEASDSFVSGARAPIIEGRDGQVNVTINSLAAHLSGVPIEDTNIGGIEFNAFGVGAGVHMKYNPTTNKISIHFDGGAVARGEAQVDISFEDLSLSGSWNGYLGLETGAGVSLPGGFGVGLSGNVTFDESQVTIGGQIGAVFVGVDGEAQILDPFKEAPCFPSGTLITLAGGSQVGIETIQEGGEVKLREAGLSGTVTRFFSNVTDEWLELAWTDPATGEARQIVSTPGHVFLAPDGTYKRIIDMVDRTAHVASPLANVSGRMVGAVSAGRATKAFISLVKGIRRWVKSLNATHAFITVNTGTNLKATDRLLRAAGATCVGGAYVV